MKLIFLGDICGRPGREAAADTVPRWKEEHQPDLVIANAENAANGQLPQPKHLEELQAAGIDAFTVGDHVRDRDFAPLEKFPIVHPNNLKEQIPGLGYRVVESATHGRLGLMSLLGSAFVKLESTNYYQAAEKLLEQAAVDQLDATLLDFHGEVTSEKNSLAFELDGRISAVVGTHTHVPTADTKLLPNGTAFQSDVGMCGGLDSVLGFSPHSARLWLGRELGETPSGRVPFEMAEGPTICDAVLIETAGPATATSIRRLTTRPSA